MFNFLGMLLHFSSKGKGTIREMGPRIHVSHVASPICVCPTQPTLDLVFNLFYQQRKVSTVDPLHLWPFSLRALFGCAR